MTIFVSAGHHATKPGAGFPGFYEHDEATLWADLIVEYLTGDAMRVPNGLLKDKIKYINARAPKLAIEIHFNSAVIQGDQVGIDEDGDPMYEQIRIGKGCETLYYPGSVSGKKAAVIVQSALADIFPPDRGIKEGWYRMQKEYGPDYFLAKTKCPALILEPEFIHLKGNIISNRERACREISLPLISALEALEND